MAKQASDGATVTHLECQMEEGCAAPVTYMDVKGFIYCTDHGKQRQDYQRCRKLRPGEIKTLTAGGAVAHY